MISVVIPAYNEEKFLASCLESLINQKTSHEFEVIVVDNNSTDRTSEIANSYKDTFPGLRVIHEHKKGRGQARFTGFAAANGSIILSTDADTTVPADWIETYAQLFEQDKTIAAATGTWKIEDSSPFINSTMTSLVPHAMRTFWLLYGHHWLNGFNFAIRKDMYVKSGGFSTSLGAQEDVDLSIRVAKIGKIKFLPRLKVISSGRRFRNGFVRETNSYFTTYLQYRLLRRQEVDIRDHREL
jgi:glycosyltransferase involved in cell wall biosynthesis